MKKLTNVFALALVVAIATLAPHAHATGIKPANGSGGGGGAVSTVSGSGVISCSPTSGAVVCSAPTVQASNSVGIVGGSISGTTINLLGSFTSGVLGVTTATGALTTMTLTGLTATGTTLSNNLNTGVSGGQGIVGDTAANGHLTIIGTSSGTHTTAYVGFGTSQAFLVQDNGWISVAKGSLPQAPIDIGGTGGIVMKMSAAASDIISKSGGPLYVATSDANSLVFQTTNVSRAFVPPAGGFAIGDGATTLATNATDGFFYPPKCGGTPSGVPNTPAGDVAMCYDAVAHKLWVHDGSWRGGTTPGAFAMNFGGDAKEKVAALSRQVDELSRKLSDLEKRTASAEWALRQVRGATLPARLRRHAPANDSAVEVIYQAQAF